MTFNKALTITRPLRSSRNRRSPWAWRYMLLLITLGVFLVFQPLQAYAQGGNIWVGLNPGQVFEITAQIDNGADYHHFAPVNGELGVCDLSRPWHTRRCHIDLDTLIQHLNQLAVVQVLDDLPASIQWEGWDWGSMSQREGGYTAVALAVDISAHDNNQWLHWWLACSVVPDNPGYAACMTMHSDQVQYLLLNAEQVMALWNWM